MKALHSQHQRNPLVYVSLFFLLILHSVQAFGSRAESGFILKDNAASPISGSYSGARPPIKFENPDEATIIIYSHGTVDANIAEDCGLWLNRPPESILVLSELPDTFIYYLCSETIAEDAPDLFTVKRALEIVTTINEMVVAGVNPSKIFLAGHSAGGWSSLMASFLSNHNVNAVIAFAPSCCGPRIQKNEYAIGRSVWYPEQVKMLLRAPRIEALIFAYENDLYNRPEELYFLKDKFGHSVRLIGYWCLAGHNSHIGDCKESKTKSIIKNYVKERLNAR